MLYTLHKYGSGTIMIHNCTISISFEIYWSILPDDGVRRPKHVRVNNTTLKVRKFVVHNTIRQTEISALADSWATKASSVKILCKQTVFFSLHFRNNITCFSVGLLMICQAFSVSCTTVGYGKFLFHEQYLCYTYCTCFTNGNPSLCTERITRKNFFIT